MRNSTLLLDKYSISQVNQHRVQVMQHYPQVNLYRSASIVKIIASKWYRRWRYLHLNSLYTDVGLPHTTHEPSDMIAIAPA